MFFVMSTIKTKIATSIQLEEHPRTAAGCFVGATSPRIPSTKYWKKLGKKDQLLENLQLDNSAIQKNYLDNL